MRVWQTPFLISTQHDLCTPDVISARGSSPAQYSRKKRIPCRSGTAMPRPNFKGPLANGFEPCRATAYRAHRPMAHHSKPLSCPALLRLLLFFLVTQGFSLRIASLTSFFFLLGLLCPVTRYLTLSLLIILIVSASLSQRTYKKLYTHTYTRCPRRKPDLGIFNFSR